MPTLPSSPEPNAEPGPLADLAARARRLARNGSRIAASLVRWTVLGVAIGVVAGLAVAGFLASLTWATETRLDHPWLLYLLPLAGLLVGLVYHHFGGDAVAGNNLILDEIHQPRSWIPRRMAPLIYAATIVTQLFGGSAGREGTAIQMSGSLGDLLARIVHLGPRDRRILLIAAIAAGFGAAFGVPFAGCVFALEVQATGELRHEAIVPALVASVVGDLVVQGVGIDHVHLVEVGEVELTVALLLKVAVFGIACGLAAIAFVDVTHAVRRVAARFVGYPPLRPFIGGLLIIAMTAAVGTRAYLGLSEDLLYASLVGGVGIATFAFLWKLLFTAVTLGTGFQGGEVTPLLVIGATLGVTLGRVLDVPTPLLAAVGFAAVFAGASNTPIACTIMGAELFGGGPIVPIAIGCVLSYVISTDHGIYSSQRHARTAVDAGVAPPPADPNPRDLGT